MNLAIVQFNDSNEDRIPTPRRAEYQNVLGQAIEACRPAAEAWTIVTHERYDATMLTFEFSNGTEAPRSITYLPAGDDAEHSGLFKTACQFLRVCIGRERLRRRSASASSLTLPAPAASVLHSS